MWRFLAKFFSKAWQAVAGKALGSQRGRASMVVHQGSGWRTVDPAQNVLILRSAA